MHMSTTGVRQLAPRGPGGERDAPHKGVAQGDSRTHSAVVPRRPPRIGRGGGAAYADMHEVARQRSSCACTLLEKVGREHTARKHPRDALHILRNDGSAGPDWANGILSQMDDTRRPPCIYRGVGDKDPRK
ncbi:hypothetical protein GGTG_06419 [Gaeumannomyces tritici R3-111a-1]|uniref:Uncharacterized protein n=1 Tax=Gaeumannomyces tritici (strain R3-111a-1) TaxID=644352 RepID=J3NYR7_GAET3|nr:hypothetical protein GGTG_06419 [Gaeumannomyces tritici R3-111a-1]EJT76500.1 hypothetical protein GGTG_06419 [Gaeumannomyces tritici R3-111a-1]